MVETQETGPESFGIGVCRCVGTAPAILGLVLSGVGSRFGRQIDDFRLDSYKLSGPCQLSRALVRRQPAHRLTLSGPREPGARVADRFLPRAEGAAPLEEVNAGFGCQPS